MKDRPLFNLLYQEYQAVPRRTPINQNFSTPPIPQGFPSEYANWLDDEKLEFVRDKANKKAYRLACILYPNATEEEKKAKVKEIHTKAKRAKKLRAGEFIGHEGWENIYQWLCDRIADANKIKGKENL